MQPKIPREWEVKRVQKVDRPGPKDTPLEYQQSNAEALIKLVEHFDNNRSRLATALGVPPSNVFQWIRLNRVSKSGALRIDGMADLPFTKEELRGDVKDWSAVKLKAFEI
jgi:hypothetical protein